MKNSIFNAVCKVKFLAVLLLLTFAYTSAWGTMYIEYPNNTTANPGGSLTVNVDLANDLYKSDYVQIKLKNSNSGTYDGWTLNNNSCWIDVSIAGSHTPSKIGFEQFPPDAGTSDGWTWNNQYGTQNVNVYYRFDETGDYSATLSVSQKNYNYGTTQQSGSFTINFHVTRTTPTYTITYHLTGLVHGANNPVGCGSNTSYFDAYFNYDEGYGSPLIVKQYTDGFGCPTNNPCDLEYGYNGTGQYVEGNPTAEWRVRYYDQVTDNIHIYLEATPISCDEPTFANTALSFYYLETAGIPTGYQVQGGQVSNKHGETVSKYGWVYGTTNPPTTADSKLTYSGDVTEGSTFSGYGNATNLSYGIMYYFRAYATSCGTGYGTTYQIRMPCKITLDKNNSDDGSTNGTAYIVDNATSFYSSGSTTAPTRTGYTLEGYYTTPNCTTKIATTARALQSGVTVSGNTWTNNSSQWKRGANETFYAKWTAKTSAITFDKNSGTGGSDGTTGTYGEAMPTITPPTRDGATFAGYFDAETDDNGSGTQYYNADGTSARNWDKNTTSATTLYAKWGVAIHWIVNGVDWSLNPSEHGNPTTAVASGEKPTQLPTTPVAGEDGCGSKFMGWTTAPIDGSRGTAPTPQWNSLTYFQAVTAETWYYAVFADENP